jgi:hypothetical protein
VTKQRYSVGDKVLVSRDESGENHVPGTVVDSYELIIGDERRPIVVVDFEDGERKYMTATTPNVLPDEPEEDESTQDESAEDESTVEDVAAGEASDDHAVPGEED